MVLQTISVPVFATGEAESTPQMDGTYYVLRTEADLNWFASKVNGGEISLNAKLGEDIVVSDSYTPIGTKENSFKGIFDGNNKSVTLNVGVDSPGASDRYGFIGTLGAGTVKNLTIKGTVDMEKKFGNVGGIAGFAEIGSTIENCINEADISGRNNIGGIVGMSKATIRDCGNKGKISTKGTTNAGGIVGLISTDTPAVSGCYNIGNIIAKTSVAGGIAGACMATNTTLNDCYNTGVIGASTSDRNGYSGGIIGQLTSGKTITVQNIYNVGNIEGKTKDSICGKSMGTINATNVYCLNTMPSVVKNVTKLSSDALKATDLGTAFAADTEGINNGYPILKWQSSGGVTPGLKDFKGTLSISGDLCCYSALTANYKATSDEEGVSLSYHWYRNGAAIENATEASYKVTEDDLTSNLTVAITADGYNPLTSAEVNIPNLVAISAEPAGAKITVTKDGKEYPNVDGQPGVYSLPAGTYSYTVSMGADSEYIDKKDTFTVPGTDSLEVTLEEKTYVTEFAIKPDGAADAKITVKDSQGKVCTPDKSTGKYQLKKGGVQRYCRAVWI